MLTELKQTLNIPKYYSNIFFVDNCLQQCGVLDCHMMALLSIECDTCGNLNFYFQFSIKACLRSKENVLPFLMHIKFDLAIIWQILHVQQ